MHGPANQIALVHELPSIFCRTHQYAIVVNRLPRVGSKRFAAFIRPMQPSCTRSERVNPILGTLQRHPNNKTKIVNDQPPLLVGQFGSIWSDLIACQIFAALLCWCQ